ncbi:thiol reductant ABC exporter subunit CydC [Thioalkalivibrio sp. ALJT]|uniref:thiol reductant ABC exporter subunit CydC n=1 Tax=Thioalkalivibrio sp. ALJT TaxID=1158146 RepID=UPI000477D82F|nr:thiol reductant ABC exporter subunit CydC [Thioalkalivibrio sp. ALJT]
MHRHGLRDLRFLHAVFRQRQLWYWGAWALLALTWVAGIVLLALSGWFITATALAGAGLLATLDIYVPSGGIRTAAIARTLARYSERLVSHEAVLRSLADLRGRTFRGLAARPARWIRAYRSGDLQTRLTGDIDTLDAMPLRVVGPIVAAALSLLVTLVLASWLAPWPATALLLAAGILTLLVSLLLAWIGQRDSRQLVRARARERIALADYIGGLAELIAFHRAHDTEQTLARQNRDHARQLTRQESVGTLTEPVVQAVVAASSLLMLLLALHWYAHGQISAPVAVLLPLMTLGLGEVLGSLPGAWWRAGESLAAARRVRHVIAQGSTRTDHPEQPDPAAPPQLSTQALVTGFESRRPLSGPLDLAPAPGTPLIVTAPSGRGKSTLLDTLAGEQAPLGGSVRLGSTPLDALPVDARYARISYLPQTLHLPDTRIREILAPGAHDDHPDAALWDALHQVDLADRVGADADGLDARIGEGGQHLSGGQRQRLALAALILQDRPIVLLDEPFSGLDSATIQRILQRLQPWLDRRQCVLVTHAPDALPPHWERLELSRPVPASSTDSQALAARG